jgi:hypothetical protein
MSARDESVRGLDACGCCTGTAASTPVQVANRPGLSAVAYRAGTHATFLQTSLAALSAAGAAPGGVPPLQALTARDGDFTPALLDAWAVVGDVLTFYSERIANETYLRTATERRSVLELARAIGYELNPGVAASTHLAFTLDTAPGSPEEVDVVRGTRAQSVPGPQETPQSFETEEALLARPVWNRLLPRLTRPQKVHDQTLVLSLAGTPAPVQPGDLLLVRSQGVDSLRTVVATRIDAPGLRTLATLDSALDGPPALTGGTDPWEVFVFRQRASVFGHNAADWTQLNDETRSRYEGNKPSSPEACSQPGDWIYLPPVQTQWPGFPLPSNADSLDLDNVYPRLFPGSWMVLRAPGQADRLLAVASVTEVAPMQFLIAGKVTRVGLDAATDLSVFGRRTTTVFIQSERLARADEPDPEPVWNRELTLGARVEEMRAGRTVIVQGRPMRVRVAGVPGDDIVTAVALRDAEGAQVGTAATGDEFSLRRIWYLDPPDAPDVRVLLRDAHGVESYARASLEQLEPIPSAPDDEEVAEVAVVEEWKDDDPEHPVIRFTAPLRHVYDRATTSVLGNVAYATHGESVAERLGSGDGATAFQRFALKQKPLTHTPDDSPDGGASTLEVRVGELRWTEVPFLYRRGPRDRVFVTRRQDDGTTVVQFGDGAEGARLPTGRENVQAVYRKGIGRDGNVRGRQLSLLLTRELGVRDVVNPLPATGGMDPQEREDARRNAPVTVLTLERVVSLCDYEDFARAFAGVAMAQAVWTWDGRRRGVFLTVAGPQGDEIPDGGTVHANLRAALTAAGDPHVPVRVASYRARPFRVQATLRAEPDRLGASVLRDAEAALLARFSFSARAFGRPVWLSDVIATLQNVPGVDSVDVDQLYRVIDSPGLSAELPAAQPEAGGDASAAVPAELLAIRLEPGDLEVAE